MCKFVQHILISVNMKSERPVKRKINKNNGHGDRSCKSYYNLSPSL